MLLNESTAIRYSYNATNEQVRTATTRSWMVVFYIHISKEVITMEKTTMSVQELSAQMGISLAKAYELVKTPGFPTLRIGTRILIPVDAYKTWLINRSAGR